MLSVLRHIESQLPVLLAERAAWHSLDIDYHAPRVERLWRQVGRYRVYLHCIHPCTVAEALYHPHPWASAIRILQGSYIMPVGYGQGSSPPPIATTLLLRAGSAYEMIDPAGWHAVAPVDEPVYSLMVTDKPWDKSSHKREISLQPLPQQREQELLALFQCKYS